MNVFHIKEIETNDAGSLITGNSELKKNEDECPADAAIAI